MIDLLKKIYYKLLSFYTLGKGKKITINNHELRFPERYYKYFAKDYEKENYQFLSTQCKKGDTVIDIGAHMGLFSVWAASFAGPTGKVFSFEPTPSTFKLLQRTIRLNKFENIVTPVNAAVSAKKGTTKFYIADAAADNSNSLVNYGDNVHKEYTVHLITVDDFTQEHALKIDFLKIDAEGAELSVLKGAAKVLTEQRPICILAMHPASIKKFGDSNEDIWNYIETKPYTVWYRDKKIDKAFFCAKTELFDVHLLPA